MLNFGKNILLYWDDHIVFILQFVNVVYQNILSLIDILPFFIEVLQFFG